MSPHAPARRAAVGGLVGSLAALWVLAAPGALATTPDELADFDAKADYAFLTADARALDHLVADHGALATSSRPLERYQYAHAQFRRLQLAVEQRRPREADRAGSACLSAIAAVNEDDPRFVEGLVLEAACAAYVALPGGLRSIPVQHRSDSRLAEARALAPAHPRVLLVAALALWFRPGAGEAERREARTLFESATRAFEAVTASEPGQPTWGSAESWLFVGRSLEGAGDLLGARNAYEKALLVAPEFAAARRRLAALAAPH